MAKLVAFICDNCHTFAKEDDKKGWITLYASLNPHSKKNTTFHLCPNCARDAILKLWDNPEAVALESKMLLSKKLAENNDNY
ncbi:MAG: hypothetical protein ACI35S_05410 [Anaeroplasma sp.]